MTLNILNMDADVNVTVLVDSIIKIAYYKGALEYKSKVGTSLHITLNGKMKAEKKLLAWNTGGASVRAPDFSVDNFKIVIINKE